MNDCYLLQNDELQVLVGNNRRRYNPMYKGGYPGIWSLTSVHRPFNVFGNCFAGLIPNLMRQEAVVLERIDDAACRLSSTIRKDKQLDMAVEYRLGPVSHMDVLCTVCVIGELRRRGCSHGELEFASYMNSPDQAGVYYVSGSEVREHCPEPGVGATMFPSYEDASKREFWPDNRSFHWSRSESTFDRPFYFGRLHNMYLAVVFRKTDRVRFSMNPIGGGGSLIPGGKSPAWDFYWSIQEEDIVPGATLQFGMRMIYKPYVSDLGVIEDCERAVEDLG